ncbi:OX-2 membrane glycoprotein [Astyanax mexicanus]|uniref:OX-2 membrane glycoprotein n=1 Tax=Astyanax mexicanus TaxID=7994 RepID=UPI000440EE9E|nr:OX-2 membrane glycoprotein [Astyanax mexicanus]
MLDYTVLFSLLALACSGGIVFEGDLSATLGLSASLSCSLPGVGGIKQVTWQHRDPAGSVHAVITLSESLEQLVGEQYAGKVQLAADSLNATTLLIRNITFAEEGCYTCKFYVYPSGTVRETSCLSVSGLTGIETSKALPDPTEKRAASCSATGKPAPVVRWMCEGQEIRASSDNNITNEDGTVTTTSYLASLPEECSGETVECVAESGKMKLTEHLQRTFNTTENASSRRYLASGFAAVVCVLIVIGVYIITYIRKGMKDRNKPPV